LNYIPCDEGLDEKTLKCYLKSIKSSQATTQKKLLLPTHEKYKIAQQIIPASILLFVGTVSTFAQTTMDKHLKTTKTAAPKQVKNPSTTTKTRIFVLTDIENEPDDAMSLVRFLAYSNQFDVEGLAATTSIHQKNKVRPQKIEEIVAAYGKVRDNLELHEPGFPTIENLQSCITEGMPLYGLMAVARAWTHPLQSC
jgi:hypothetical protein